MALKFTDSAVVTPRFSTLIIFGLMTLMGGIDSTHAQVGTMPIPETDTARVDDTVETLKASGTEPAQYIYRYTIFNPPTSKNSLYKFSLDISAPDREDLHPTLKTVPVHAGKSTRPFSGAAGFFGSTFFGRYGNRVVSIGLECPDGWNGGLQKDGSTYCYSTNYAPQIEPGESMSGFAIHSRNPPMLRESASMAFWTVVVDSLEDDNVDRVAAYKVLEDLYRPQPILGPAHSHPTKRLHFVFFQRDLAEMISIGWISDAGLADELTTVLADTIALFDANRGSDAKRRLDDVIAALANSNESEINSRARTLLSVNVDSIRALAGSTLIGGRDKEYRFEQVSQVLNLGEWFELGIYAFSNEFDPQTGKPEVVEPATPVWIGCDQTIPLVRVDASCPNFSKENRQVMLSTDNAGVAKFEYVGTKVGRDNLQVCADMSCDNEIKKIVVDWESQVDLVVRRFTPPIILAASGDVIRFSESTTNIGDGPAASSVTRFYVSDSPHFDPRYAVLVGEHTIPPLVAGASSDQSSLDFPLPPGFDQRPHFLVACADAAANIQETNERNNCSDVPPF